MGLFGGVLGDLSDCLVGDLLSAPVFRAESSSQPPPPLYLYCSSAKIGDFDLVLLLV